MTSELGSKVVSWCMKFCTDLFSWQTKEIFSLIAYTHYIIMHYIFFLASDLSLFVMWLNVIQLKLENIQIAFSIFHKILHDIENIWRTINTIAPIRYLSLDIICSAKVSLPCALEKWLLLDTDNVNGQILLFEYIFTPNRYYCLYNKLHLGITLSFSVLW